MKEEEKDNKVIEFFKRYWLIFVMMFALGLAFLFKGKPKPPTKISKKDLADQYGVPVELLMKWASRFLPEEYKTIYVGEKVKTVNQEPFYEHLGKPKNRPKTSEGKVILSKADLAESLFLNQSTLMRNIKKIPKPEVLIGISYEVYKSSRTFPPKQTQMIIDYFNEIRKVD